jgi:predicted AAA+ superfamily ATPase
MTRDDYRPRIYDDRLRALLSVFGGVLVEGPKWCGKTWTSQNACASELLLADPEGGYATRRLVQADVGAALSGNSPRMIDEWQEVPEVWDAVRFEIDRAGKRGMFILTGSSTPSRKSTIHSGTGRIARLRMGPMTLFESGASRGEVPFACLAGDMALPRAENPLRLEDIAGLCVRGGWPANISVEPGLSHEVPLQYIDSLVNEDAIRYDGVGRDPAKMRLLLRSLARNNQTIVSKRTLLADIGQISEPTLNSYLDALRGLFVLNNIPAWSPNVRSRSRLRTGEKVRLVDPSLAAAALRIGAKKLSADLETLGFLFECLVARDIMSYAEVSSAMVYHYREASNQGRGDLEVDLVIESADDDYSLVEVKLGAGQIDDAERTLIKAAGKLCAAGAKPPRNLAIVCGTVPFAYTTEQGVKVVPIGCLGA